MPPARVKPDNTMPDLALVSVPIILLIVGVLYLLLGRRRKVSQ